MRLPRLKFTIRALMIAVAIVALGLGLWFQIQKWRRLAAVYQAEAARHAALETEYQRRLLWDLGPGHARPAWLAGVASLELHVAHHANLAEKYRDAADRPWWPAPPDPPPPTKKDDPESFRAAVLRVALRSKDAEYLDLSSTGFEDEDLALLGELRNLKHLVLVGTNVSDAGLEHLKVLPDLKELAVFRTRVTREGASRLAREMPGLTVSY
jgi:hypothetical protein